jgi:hypothetical protein
MAPTLPIPAEQPLDAAWKAAGQVVTLAGAEAVAVQAVAVQAAASFTRAALLWPPIPAARAMAGLASALGPWLPLRPLADQPVVVVRPGSGGAGRAATVPGSGPGAVRAAARSRWGWRRSSCCWTRPPAPRCWPAPIWCGCSAGNRACSRS